MVAGVLPRIATSFDVSVQAAGQLVTVFALSYAVLSPVMAAFTARWPRKRVLLTGLAVLMVGNIATAVLPTFGLALASRVLAGLGAAMYTPTASGAAAALVPPEQRGRALAVVMAGLSGATALGAPIGTLIGHASNWRITTVFVAVLCALAFAGVAFLLPPVPGLPSVSLRKRIAPIGDARVAFTLLTTVFLIAGLHTVYTYISVSYDRATGGGGTALAILLCANGVAATVGNLGSGSLTDRFGSRRIINVALAVAAVDFALMPLTSMYFWTSVLAIVVWGLCGWGVLVPQQHRLIQISPASAPLTIALNASAIYVAVSMAGMMGALGINLVGAHNLGLVAAALIASGFAAAELARSLIARSLRTRAPEPSAIPMVTPAPS
ncbi:MFS transporter [Virgisporangium aurantiacum]|uniref:MFS transporter n=1 Tax=Virgisporangium aurantiacum TaxID=175570 RepID=A0A8J3ZHW6_9ACTN|nr:MFS transporter [Virgisporangium aurantiacum]